MKIFALFLLLTFFYGSVSAQDTARRTYRNFDSTFFANDDTLTKSDYLLALGRAFQTLNNSSVVSQPVPVIQAINRRMDEDDSALLIIKGRLSSTDRMLNVRNVQMFSTLLDQLDEDTRKYSARLKTIEEKVASVKDEIQSLRRDTVIRQVFRTAELRASFRDQLRQLRTKRKTADSLVRAVTIQIDNTFARSSANLLLIEELQNQVQTLLKTTGVKAFSKERRYLWEPRRSVGQRAFTGDYKNIIAEEKQITQYYFTNTRNQLFLLLVSGIVFFFWIFFNYRSLARINKLAALDDLRFKYIKPIPIFASLVFMLNLAPLFDLNAPEIYIQSMVVLLMITLTLYFSRFLPKVMFYWWLLFMTVFVLLLFYRLLGLPYSFQRWWLLAFNGISFVLASFFLIKYKKRYVRQKVFLVIARLYILLNFLAVLCNLFGRVTLTNIFSSTAIYAFVQVVGLVIFIQILRETFLLQIQGSRLRRQYPQTFDFEEISKGICRPITYLAVVIWFVVFTTNLNIYGTITDQVMMVLETPRKLGSLTFTFRGVILFGIIIWSANFLQKYIAYFFGDVGDDASFDNKGQRSKLLITRLVLLTTGFLLAVAASGLPVDKITVILGALGIGIGLGLQSIVNNFVSGIILIFDRPLRIGDTVEIGDRKGRVKEISVRSSTLLTPDGAEVIIPNGDILSHNIVNWTLSNNHKRVDVSFTVDKFLYSEDILADISAMIKELPDVLPQKDPEIIINTLTSQSTQLKIFFWCRDISKTEFLRSAAYSAIYRYLEGKQVKIIG